MKDLEEREKMPKDCSKKIIGILGRPIKDSENENAVAIYDGFRVAVIEKNCIPFLITPPADIDYVDTLGKDIPKLTSAEEEILRQMVDMCDGLIIPGGYRWYNYDIYVLDYAISKDIPVLGICMGMQLIGSRDNNYNSKECLVRNESSLEHRQVGKNYAHSVNIVPNTKLMSIINEKTLFVNSKHRYHISKVNDLVVSAYSEDGLIEAVEYPNKKFVIGVQWHPERMIKYDKAANDLFDAFISKM